MYLSGLADLITALTGTASLAFSLFLVWRMFRLGGKVDTIEHLTNSNFSRMQKLLSEANAVTEQSAERDRERLLTEREDES